MTKRLVLISTSTLLAVASMMVMLLGSIESASAATLIKLSDLKGGDLVRGVSYSAVYYYGADGFRYVFPNDKTFFTWYSNFDSVKWVSDADMTKIQIGGNVTYKPGAKMIKINSDPTVYAISAGGYMRAIKSEAVAKALYGSNWNKQIDDIPDGFFSNYKMGGSLDDASMFSVSGEKTSAVSIDTDKSLKAATLVTISDSGYSPASITIKAGTAVKFLNSGAAKHSASDDNGDWGTGTLNAGDRFSRYFKTSGIYQYHDTYGTAKGTIVVE